MFKQFLSWALGTWIGSLSVAVVFAGLIFGSYLAYSSMDKDMVREIPLPPEVRAQGVLYPINRFGIPYQWHLLQPDVFGVYDWTVGDVSRYQLKDPKNTGDREITFEVLAGLEPDHAVAQHYQLATGGKFWLKVSGFKGFREIPETLYHLASSNDLRVNNTWLSFRFKDDYIPLHNSVYDRYPLAPFAALTKIGPEEIETPAGRFLTTRYEARIGEVTLDVWTHPKVSPLGVVRIQGKDQSLELLSYGRRDGQDVPTIMQPLVDGTSTLKDGCRSCHKSAEECHIRVFPPT
jgi:hypothetical protein